MKCLLCELKSHGCFIGDCLRHEGRYGRVGNAASLEAEASVGSLESIVMCHKVCSLIRENKSVKAKWCPWPSLELLCD